MRLLYDSTGRILYAVYDRDWFSFTHTTNVPMTEMVIDEVDGNKALCADLYRNYKRVDSMGDNKYRINAGQLEEKQGWMEVANGI